MLCRILDSYRDSSGRTVAHYISESSAQELLSLLLSVRADAIYDTDSNKRTPLHWAAVSNGISLLPALLRAGASLPALDNAGMTALGYAVAKGYKVLL